MSSSSVREQSWARYIGPDYCVPVARAQRAFLRGVTLPWMLYIAWLFVLFSFKNSPVTYITLALWFCFTRTLDRAGGEELSTHGV
jgi:hypothetical protein